MKIYAIVFLLSFTCLSFSMDMMKEWPSDRLQIQRKLSQKRKATEQKSTNNQSPKRKKNDCSKGGSTRK